MIEDIQFTNLERVLKEYGEAVAQRYRTQLDTAGKNASSTLRNTLRPYVKNEGSIYTLYLALQDYWKYLEQGTRKAAGHAQGKFPPVSVFEAWIKAKPVVPYKGKDGRIPTPKQLAFLIARKVWRDGTKPFWFLEKSLHDKPDAVARCEEAIKQDIEAWIRQIIADFKI